jgi:hypothetical protein
LSNETVSEKFIQKLKNNSYIAALVVLVAIIGGIGAFTDSIEKIVNFLKPYFVSSPFTITGSVIIEAGADAPQVLCVTVLWYFDGQGDTVFQSDRVFNINTSTGTMNFQLNFNGAPPGPVLMKLDNAEVAIGYIVVFDDTNKNGYFDSKEKIISASADYAVTYLIGNIRAVKLDDPGKSLYTLLELPQGYALTKKVSPEEHGFPVPFDDLRPVDNRPVDLVIRKDGTYSVPEWT